MSVLCQVIPPVALQSQLKTNSKKQTIIKHLEGILGIVSKTKIFEDNPLIVKTRMTLQMTEFTCNLIENLLPSKNNGKYDKKSLAVEVLTDVYNLTPDEQTVINTQIQYIYDSNLIFRIPFISKMSNAIVPFLKKFLP